MAQLSNEVIEACREAFEKFDKDGSGSISDWELKAMLQCAIPLAQLQMTSSMMSATLSTACPQSLSQRWARTLLTKSSST